MRDVVCVGAVGTKSRVASGTFAPAGGVGLEPRQLLAAPIIRFLNFSVDDWEEESSPCSSDLVVGFVDSTGDFDGRFLALPGKL